METAIRWSPGSTISEQRFLIADVNGKSFKHCKVDHYDGKTLRYGTLSTHQKVPAFRAFDWSPKDENIVAVGQWSGETTVLRIDDKTQTLSLPIKHQRLCNAVSFSKTGLLATGLERVRNDFCLNVWDISQDFAVSSPQVTKPGRDWADPIRKLASSEAITSIKFFAGQPDTLIAGVKGACIRVYDLRENVASPSLQFPTFSVHNIAIDPLDENYFASAGPLKDTTIHIWDRRSGQSSTAAILGSGTASNTQHGPILEFRKPVDTPKNAVSPSIWSLRYCKGQSGFLGVLASTGDFKVFETKKEYNPGVARFKPRRPSAVETAGPHSQQIFTERVHQVEHAYDDGDSGRQESKRIVSFDFTNLAGVRGRPCAITLRGDQSIDIFELKGPPSALAVSPMGGLVTSKVGRVALSGGPFNDEKPPNTGVCVLTPHREGSISDDLKAIRARTAATYLSTPSRSGAALPEEAGNDTPDMAEKPHSSSREAHERLCETPFLDSKCKVEDALNVFTVDRRRCAEGYLFDCKKNVEIVSDDPWLQDLWSWIDRAKGHAENEGMVVETLDLSYLGVFGIWNNSLGTREVSRRTSKLWAGLQIASAVESLSKSLQLPETLGIATAFPRQRQLCLYTCGLGLPYQELEDRVKHLVRQGQNTKAAALAIVHDQAKLAFFALRSGAASPAHRELSLALAGFVKGRIDDTWDETVRDVAKDLDDPYARAILALVSYGDWHDFLMETSLPLKDRIAVALMYLSDEELTQYISTTTAECIKHGDVEGIVLTGLTEKAIPLFQNYLLRFCDLQTAILALSFTSPRYFPSQLIDTWRETYRTSLNTYRLFIPRVHFDVQSTKLSTAPNRKPTLLPPPRQMSLRCNDCDRALDRNPTNNNPAPLPPSFSTPQQQQQPTNPPPPLITHQGSIFADNKSGTVCPKCRRHLPRCVICMMWLGMPDPHLSRGSSAATSSSVLSGGAASATAAVAEKASMLGKAAMKEFISVCRGCWHMSHGAHAEEWFAGHEICAVPGCECRCVEVDAGGGI